MVVPWRGKSIRDTFRAVSLVRSLIPHQFVRGVKQVDFLASQAEQDAGIAALQDRMTAAEADVSALYARTPRPQLALTGISPAPAGMSVPVAPGFLDLPVFALTIDDRADVTILAGGTYFRVEGEVIDHVGQTVRLATFLDLRVEDTSGAGGNVEWQVNAISGTDLGNGMEILFEDTLYHAAVSSNLRLMQFGSAELFEIPGLAIAEFGVRASHNAGGPRTLDLLSLEAGFQQQAVTA